VTCAKAPNCYWDAAQETCLSQKLKAQVDTPQKAVEFNKKYAARDKSIFGTCSQVKVRLGSVMAFGALGSEGYLPSHKNVGHALSTRSAFDPAAHPLHNNRPPSHISAHNPTPMPTPQLKPNTNTDSPQPNPTQPRPSLPSKTPAPSPPLRRTARAPCVPSTAPPAPTPTPT